MKNLVSLILLASANGRILFQKTNVRSRWEMLFSVVREWTFDEGDEVTLPLTPSSSRTIYLIKVTSTSHVLLLAIFFSPLFISLEVSKLT